MESREKPRQGFAGPAPYPCCVGASEQLGALWPEASQRVGRVLRSRGLHGDRVNDVLQEVAVRALRADAPLESVDRFAAWAYVVATRVLIDDARARGTLALVEDPMATARLDPGRVVEGRIEWERALRAMARLSPADRSILLATLDDSVEVAADRREAVRNAVRRHRARARLAAAMDRIAAAVGSVLLRIRQPWARGLTAAAVGGTTLALVLGMFPGGHRHQAEASPPPDTITVPAPSPAPAAAAPPTAAGASSAPDPAPPSAPIGGGGGKHDEEDDDDVIDLPGASAHGGARAPTTHLPAVKTLLDKLPQPPSAAGVKGP